MIVFCVFCLLLCFLLVGAVGLCVCVGCIDHLESLERNTDNWDIYLQRQLEGVFVFCVFLFWCRCMFCDCFVFCVFVFACVFSVVKHHFDRNDVGLDGMELLCVRLECFCLGGVLWFCFVGSRVFFVCFLLCVFGCVFLV